MLHAIPFALIALLPFRQGAVAPEARPWTPPLTIERGEGQPVLLVPRDEELTFRVKIALGILGEHEVGTMVLSSTVEPYRENPLLMDSPTNVASRWVGLLRARAVGAYAFYTVDQKLETRHLPTAWPRILSRSDQKGSENRKRELQIGVRDGESLAIYRSNRHCKGCERREHFVESTIGIMGQHHCGKCTRSEHRVWREPRELEVPRNVLDMLSAILMVRGLVDGQEDVVRFQLLDRRDLWNIELTRGETRRIVTLAGAFDGFRVLFDVSRPEGYEGDDEDFEGLFGLHGSVHIWVSEKGGVPLLIEGVVPAGIVSLDVSVMLSDYRGTPPEFTPAE